MRSQTERELDSVKKLIPKLNSDTALIRNYLFLVEGISDNEEWNPYNEKALELVNKNLATAASEAETRMLKKYKASALNNKGIYLKDKSLYDSSIRVSMESKRLYHEVGDLSGEAVTITNMAGIDVIKGRPADAVAKYNEALIIFRDKLHDKRKTAIAYNKMAYQYIQYNNTEAAIRYLNLALELFKETDDPHQEAIVYTNFANLYYFQNEFDAALENYQKALEVFLKLKDRRKSATVYSNMALILHEKGDMKDYFKYDSLALSMYMEVDDKEGIALVYNNLGKVYQEQGDLKLAKSLITKALQIREQLEDPSGIINSSTSMSSLYLKSGMNDSALYFAIRAKDIAEKLNKKSYKRDAYFALSRSYKAKKDFEKALIYYEKFKHVVDSIVNDDSKKATNKQMARLEFEKRELEIKSEQEKHELVMQKEIAQQQLQRNAFLIGFSIALILLFFVFKNYREKKKANLEITAQKHTIEEKQKEILDSINYAKRIQDAILPAKELKYRIFPDAFVLFQPRDIVSGDFYWFAEKDNKRLIAVADCTGHGVPGAFMSMIGNTFLNEIVNVRGITQPGEILDNLREQVIQSLKQGGGENKDGMDISLLMFDDAKKTVEWAGANNPLWLIRNGECSEFKASKQPVGYYPGEKIPFSNNIIEVQKGDLLYIFSDGFADQFGGEKGKKFKYKSMKELLIGMAAKKMPEQEDLLLKAFADWKTGYDQIDDVCIIGIRIADQEIA